MNTFTFKPLAIVGLSIALSGTALAATPATESCGQIRARIQAQVGVREKPDTALLDTLTEHPSCRFTAAEVFRAAYGDRPMPKNDRRGGRHESTDDDD